MACLDSSTDHAAIESSRAAKDVEEEFQQIKAQLSEHIVSTAKRHGDQAEADKKRLDYLEAWLMNHSVTTNEKDYQVAQDVKNLKAQMANSVVSAAQTNSDLKELKSQVVERQSSTARNVVQQRVELASPAAGVSAPASKLTTERAKPPVTGYPPETADAMLDAPKPINS